MQQVRSKRSAADHAPGFYKALNDSSTADLLPPSTKRQRVQRLEVSSASGSDLPTGVYAVERLVAERCPKKVSSP